MTFKDSSVIVRDIKKELIHALAVAEDLWQGAGVELVVTSLNDGNHMEGSLHFEGRAADFRTWNIPSRMLKTRLVEDLRKQLGPRYDVVVEKDHIHLEWDPKEAA